MENLLREMGFNMLFVVANPIMKKSVFCKA